MKSIFVILFLFPTALFAQINIAEKYVLDSRVEETSGLIFHNGMLITHNDSGDGARLYEMDTITGNIMRIITISNVTPQDWEDIDQDENYIYIGDFGNNNGNRTDLKIYRVSKTDFDAHELVSAEMINFNYEDQTNFNEGPNNNWDAEALLVYNDQLIVCTKERGSQKTRAYSIPKVPGTHEAKNIGSLDVQGLITGATYNEAINMVYFTGYSNLGSPFLAQIEPSVSANFFEKIDTYKKIGIGASIGSIVQMEGIAHTSATRFLFSAEKNIDVQKLYGFNLIKEDGEGGNDRPDVIIYPNPAGDSLIISSEGDSAESVELYSLLGHLVLKRKLDPIPENLLDVSSLYTGIYFLRVNFHMQSTIKTLIKD